MIMRRIGERILSTRRTIKLSMGIYGAFYIEVSGTCTKAPAPVGSDPLQRWGEIRLRQNGTVVHQVPPLAIHLIDEMWIGEPYFTPISGAGAPEDPILDEKYAFSLLIPCTAQGHGSSLYVREKDEVQFEFEAFMDYANTEADAPTITLYGIDVENPQKYRLGIKHHTHTLSGNDKIVLDNPLTSGMLFYLDDPTKTLDLIQLQAHRDGSMVVQARLDHLQNFTEMVSKTEERLYHFCAYLDFNPTRKLSELNNAQIVIDLISDVSLTGEVIHYIPVAVEYTGQREVESLEQIKRVEAARRARTKQVISSGGSGDYPAS